MEANRISNQFDQATAESNHVGTLELPPQSLAAAIAEHAADHAAWTTTEVVTAWESKRTASVVDDAPPPAWWNSLRKVIEVATAEKVEAHFHKPLTCLIAALIVASKGKHVRPSMNLLRSREMLLAAAPTHYPPLETLGALRTIYREMPFEQFGKALGVPAAMAQDIMAGTASLPPGHVRPEIRMRRQLADEARDEYEAAVERWQELAKEESEAAAAVTPADTWSPPPESIEALICQDVSVEQICKMHRCDAATVEAIQVKVDRERRIFQARQAKEEAERALQLAEEEAAATT